MEGIGTERKRGERERQHVYEREILGTESTPVFTQKETTLPQIKLYPANVENRVSS
jgi:hypothetical protein